MKLKITSSLLMITLIFSFAVIFLSSCEEDDGLPPGFDFAERSWFNPSWWYADWGTYADSSGSSISVSLNTLPNSIDISGYLVSWCGAQITPSFAVLDRLRNANTITVNYDCTYAGTYILALITPETEITDGNYFRNDFYAFSGTGSATLNLSGFSLPTWAAGYGLAFDKRSITGVQIIPGTGSSSSFGLRITGITIN